MALLRVAAFVAKYKAVIELAKAWWQRRKARKQV